MLAESGEILQEDDYKSEGEEEGSPAETGSRGDERGHCQLGQIFPLGVEDDQIQLMVCTGYQRLSHPSLNATSYPSRPLLLPFPPPLSCLHFMDFPEPQTVLQGKHGLNG